MKYFLIFFMFFIFSLNSRAGNEVDIKMIPAGALKPCLDEKGRIASPGENWNHSDVGLGINSPPRARLIKACHTKDDRWVVLCEKGGFASTTLLVRTKKDKKGNWSKSEISKKVKEIDSECKE